MGGTPHVTRSLDVDALNISYVQGAYVERAVCDVSLSVFPGEVLGIVGESGSGKSSLAQGVMRLLPPSARIGGRVLVGGRNILELREREMCRVRGSQVGMIFQDPNAALNPVFPISTHITDTLRRHHPKISRAAALRQAGEMIEQMGIPAARLRDYPHQLSGGMRQRALIAAATAAEPEYLLADEPTSDLDTVSQAGILKLLRSLCDDRNIGILLISHDLRVIAAVCERVGVMHRGELVEVGPVDEILSRPRHRYTQGLLQVSRRDRDAAGAFIPAPDEVVGR